MPLKRRGPLQLVQREVDELKKKVDQLVKDVKSQVGSTEEAFRRCQDLQLSAEKTLKTLQNLTKADELAPVGNYDQRKQEEERRLQEILERLNDLFLDLSPPGPSRQAGDVSKDKSRRDANEEEGSSSGDNNEEDSDDDEDEEEKKALKPPSQSDLRIYTVLSDFKGEEEGDLSVQTGEVVRIIRKTVDGWWLAQDSKGNRGVVPKTFLKVDATDVLSAMGAIPSGFRPSTLSKLLQEEGESYRASHFLKPQLSQFPLSFKDLLLNPDTGRVQARQVKTCVCFTLWSCRLIPTPGVGVQVLSRHVRMCAFDGSQVLSNIHTVRAAYNPKNPKTWSFSPRTSGLLPILMDGDCFLRCNSESPNLGILFELGVTFIRNSTGEKGELSCGWAFLKLYDETGSPLSNRTYELPVNGGTPYDKNVALETPISRGSPGGVFQQMLNSRRMPKLVIKLKSTNSRTRTQLSVLPDTLLHCLSCVHLLALHRQLLAEALLIDRVSMQNSDPMCSPILASFPVLLDQTDLLDALRSAWLEAENGMSKAQKRDLSYLKQEFTKVYLSSAYFLLHLSSLPTYCWADQNSEEQRARVIYTTLSSLKTSQQSSGHVGNADILFDSTHQHTAFDISQMTFDLLQGAR
uniref:Nephronophthisis 1 n=1 Tax=Oryzias melastigma TaxID=30732 RepID=A0A3B3DHR8_ORYME